MAVSTFDLFKIGIGPSSSHTVGPMRAALLFARGLERDGLLARVAGVRVGLYGSLGTTGPGHGTDRGVILGLAGEAPDTVDPTTIDARLADIRASGMLALLGRHPVAFDAREHLRFHRRQAMAEHPNGMKFHALDAAGEVLREARWLSVGGGFVVEAPVEAPGLRPFAPVDAASIADARHAADTPALPVVPEDPRPFPFRSGRELLAMCAEHGLGVADLMWANERAWRDDDAIRDGLRAIWSVMRGCVVRGVNLGGCNPAAERELPGPLRVRRRAPDLFRQLSAQAGSGSDPLAAMDWVNLFAMAVNEENAAGGRVVTAPTNGAAGIVPAVLHYLHGFAPCDPGAPAVADRSGARPGDAVAGTPVPSPRGPALGSEHFGLHDPVAERRTFDFLLTAAAIGILYKLNASISGAEVGCQGEVGVASSMAAGALAAVLGGTPAQVENAAEIGMEHNLGLTCDPVGGQVQIPCIERNAVGAVKAINAARMALRGDGSHYVSLDSVIRTMRETGADMKRKYKETSLGGLAVNIVEC